MDAFGKCSAGTGVKAIEFVVNDEDHAGDVMFVSGWNGSLTRYSGFQTFTLKKTLTSSL